MAFLTDAMFCHSARFTRFGVHRSFVCGTFGKLLTAWPEDHGCETPTVALLQESVNEIVERVVIIPILLNNQLDPGLSQRSIYRAWNDSRNFPDIQAGESSARGARLPAHRHCALFAGSFGEAMPTFQFHGMSPLARRRQTTSSFSSYMPGISCVAGRGASVMSM
jgi:hypothetical protein